VDPSLHVLTEHVGLSVALQDYNSRSPIPHWRLGAVGSLKDGACASVGFSTLTDFLGKKSRCPQN